MNKLSKFIATLSMLGLCTGAFAHSHHRALMTRDDSHLKPMHCVKQCKGCQKPLRQSLRAKHAMLRAELSRPNIHQKRVNQLVREIEILRNQLFENRISRLSHVKRRVGRVPVCRVCHHRYGPHYSPYYFHADIVL